LRRKFFSECIFALANGFIFVGKQDLAIPLFA
jgi:hypothetical protein